MLNPMDTRDLRPEQDTQAGLCGSCAHARRIESSRGSVFVLCELSARDPAFPRYPRLPVLSCSGFARRSEGSSGDTGTGGSSHDAW